MLKRLTRSMKPNVTVKSFRSIVNGGFKPMSWILAKMSCKGPWGAMALKISPSSPPSNPPSRIKKINNQGVLVKTAIILT